MRTPLLVRFARPVTGEEPVALGKYHPSFGLRVLESPDGPIPVASCVPYASTVTKTDHAKESDDRSVILAAITRTGEPKEHDDVESEQEDSAKAMEYSGHQDWLALVTKTLNRRERDDE